MQNFRPKNSSHYIERHHLLKQMPEEAGYVVWLEAPYGYGKSVLASQWADLLEKDNWRILWLSLEGRDPKSAVAKLLNLPDFASWGIILDSLWGQPSLLVLEDLTGQEDLSSLLKHVGGLILLASRQNLSYAELPRLLSEQKLQHFTTSSLAFTLSEAEHIFTSKEQAHSTWEQTQGWPLPLQFSALTGEQPAVEDLLLGIRSSVSAVAWQEILLLAAISTLTADASTQTTQELVNAGFVQRLVENYRLHPFIAESIRQNYSEEVKEVVIKEGERLPPIDRAHAYEMVNYMAGLASLIEDRTNELFLNVPTKTVYWYRLLTQPVSTLCFLHVAIAQLQLSDIDLGLKKVNSLCDNKNISAELRLWALSKAVLSLINANRSSEVEAYIKKAELVIQQMPDNHHFTIANYLSCKAAFYLKVRNHALAEETILLAIKHLEKELKHPNKVVLHHTMLDRLHSIRYERTGDTISQSKYLMSSLDSYPRNNWNYWMTVMNIGVLNLHLNELDVATTHMDYLLDSQNDFFVLFARLVKAYLALDINSLIELNEEAKKWQFYDIAHGASAVLLRAFRRSGINNQTIERAFNLQDSLVEGPYTDIEYAHFENARGNKEGALALLKQSKIDDAEDGFIDVHHKFLWWAAHYLITRDEDSLNTLLDSTPDRDQLFHYLLIPLDSLPKHRAELSRTYPLKEVLYSDWKEAIEYRLKDDVPFLKICLLGEFSVMLLDDLIELTDRLKQIICLLALGKSRDEVATLMWPEADAKKSRNNLNVQLNFLRKAIEPWGISSYLFEDALKNTSNDYQDLMNAIEANDAEKVLLLYKEPFAPRLKLDIIEEIRERLRQDVIDVLFETTNTDFSDDEARRYLERILELESTHEEALQNLLKILIKSGRRREASKRFKYFAQQLKKEMGLEPFESTHAILNS